MSTYNNYASGNKVSSKKRYDAARKLEEMGDDLRDMYLDQNISKEIYKKANELYPSKK